MLDCCGRLSGMGEEKMATAATIAKEFNIPLSTVYSWVASGTVPAKDDAPAHSRRRRYLFLRSDVVAYLERVRQARRRP